MKSNIFLALLFFLIPIIINGQTQEATTSDGKKVILNPDGTWKYVDAKKDSKMTIDTGSGIDNSGVSYDLAGRGIRKIPRPKYRYQEEGKVVVEVSVDRSGKVIQAISGTKGSTTLNEYLIGVAEEAALKAQFDPNPNAPLIQKGTITYTFILK